MLLQSNTAGCGRLLARQIDFCERSLSSSHPLAAKILAVMARLHLKHGRMDECEKLQKQVLLMRQASLGLHHEDTHRSAMDVYTRRRQHVLLAMQRNEHDPQAAPYADFAAAVDTCLAMLQKATTVESGIEGYALSKSLQGMGEYVFQDLSVLAKRGLWPRAATLSMLAQAAEVADRLPVHLSPHVAAPMHEQPPGAPHQIAQRREVVAKLRRLHAELLKLPESAAWPPLLLAPRADV